MELHLSNSVASSLSIIRILTRLTVIPRRKMDREHSFTRSICEIHQSVDD